MPPRFFFVIDVSTQAVQSGSLPVVCQAIKDSLDSLPGSSRTQIGFLTFDSSLHFYNLKSSLSQPQMLVRSPRLLSQMATRTNFEALWIQIFRWRLS